MAAVAGNEQGQVGVLLHCLHWNGCKRSKGFRCCFLLRGLDSKVPNSSGVSFGCSILQIFNYSFLFSHVELESLNRVQQDVQGDTEVHVKKSS